uniref:Serine aminopeptidase S33 domain-containing protein n=1 Tax=Chenopodium quinoa TaxID=63459 RepID=A0A803MRP9_CHEQI
MSFNAANEPQKIVVVNDQSEKLVGLLHDTGSKDVVILCHGFTGRKENKNMVNISDALEKEGISAYRFDFSGNGESDGTFAYGNYSKEVEDIRAVVNHFNGASRSEVMLSYYMLQKYHDIRTVVNLSGRYDLKEGIAERLGEDFMESIEKNGYMDVECQKTVLDDIALTILRYLVGNVLYRVTKESLMERLNTDMHEAALKIDKNCRVLTVHGTADEIIPVEDAYEFSKIIPNHKLHIIEGANHSFTEHQDEVVPVVIDFIKSCMQQDKEISN